MINVVHIINLTAWAGAEGVLHRLIQRLHPAEVANSVISLGRDDEYLARYAALGIPTAAVGLRSVRSAPGGLCRLTRLLRAWRPDVVQTWMYHADLAGGLAARWAGCVPVAWNLRRTEPDRPDLARSTVQVARLSAWLSWRLPARIVCCAEAARVSHAAFGYDESRMVVIPNGFDSDVYRPDTSARAAVRAELGLADEPVVVLVARHHPKKDYPTFLAAAQRIAAELPTARFLLVGQDVEPANRTLMALVASAELTDRVCLLGPRTDLPRLYAAADVSCLCSLEEGFPNVVGEAMACGLPCVVTPAGDAAVIAGDTGAVVPFSDPAALSRELLALLRLPPADLATRGLIARRRIIENFSLDSMVARYRELWLSLAGRSGE